MKTLLIMRHAKSDWSNTGLSDYERPLNPRGLDAASLMGDYIFKNNLIPDVIVSSPAERAVQTARLVHQKIRLGGEIIFDNRIYEADYANLIKVIGEQSDTNDSILLVGHNPGLENLIEKLTGDSQTMPTAAVAVIDLEIEDWNDIGDLKGSLRKFVRPKELAN